MLFMVIEHFANADPRPVGERYERQGRMLPDGLVYRASWMESNGARCFQLMETVEPELLNTWISRWDDLATFEIVPVVTSADFWGTSGREGNGSFD